MQHIIQKITILVLLFVSLVFILSLQPKVLADSCQSNSSSIKNSIGGGVDCGAGTNGAKKNATSNLQSIIKTFLEVLSIFVGAIAVIMLVIGGFKLVTSAGNENSVKSAKSTITYALIGLVVVAVAQIVVFFVLEHVSKATSSTSTNGTGPYNGPH